MMNRLQHLTRLALCCLFVVITLTIHSQAEEPDASNVRVTNLRTLSKQFNFKVAKTAPKGVWRKGHGVLVAGTIIYEPDSERPFLRDFQVERRIIDATKKQNWEKLDLSVTLKLLYHSKTATDPVPKKHRNGVVTMPLPDLEGSIWTSKMAYCGQAELLDEHPDAVLFRFLDLDAKPNTKYEYRVRMVYYSKEAKKNQVGNYSKVSVPVDDAKKSKP